LLPAKRFERAIVEVGRRLIHFPTVLRGGGRALNQDNGFIRHLLCGRALAFCGQETCQVLVALGDR
jgi:hypothetical protein